MDIQDKSYFINKLLDINPLEYQKNYHIHIMLWKIF